ncbi:hypothetical protein F2Q68_00046048 [Brassica cretica]|uniref:Uncharacterized protein n=1 Tax=Brassica cretica TaxID=69181 RepID=A0A8S9LE50_BRACR|nr:hypothetical protein F2Q68_00046048 [Brassica cretica]
MSSVKTVVSLNQEYGSSSTPTRYIFGIVKLLKKLIASPNANGCIEMPTSVNEWCFSGKRSSAMNKAPPNNVDILCAVSRFQIWIRSFRKCYLYLVYAGDRLFWDRALKQGFDETVFISL